MKKNSQKVKYEFVGGLRIGIINRSWPFCELEVNENTLFLRDKAFSKEYSFSKEEISMISVKRSLPIIGCGIQIKHSKVRREVMGIRPL